MSFDHSRTLARWRSEKKRKRATDLHEVGDYLISSYESTSPDLAGAIAGLFLKSESLVLAKQEPTGSAESSDASLGFDLALAWVTWHLAIDRRDFATPYTASSNKRLLL